MSDSSKLTQPSAELDNVRLSFGNALRKFRESKSLSLKQLASATELSSFHLLKVETGEMDLAVTDLIVVATALDVSPQDFYAQLTEAKNAKLALGEMLRSHRISKALSLKELANMVNMSEARISTIEVGKADLSREDLIQLTKFLGVNPKEIESLYPEGAE